VPALPGSSSVAAATAPSAPPRALSSATAAPEAPPSVPFVADDLERALGEARASNKRVFVDVWAPWCDACLSVRAEVLTRPELARFSSRYVFASIDVDRPSSEPFLARHGVRALPTLAVLEPRSGELVSVRSGAVSFDELAAMLETAASTEGGADALASGHAAYGKGDRLAAAATFERVAATATGAARTEATLAALDAWFSAGEYARCVTLAEARARDVRAGAGPVELLGYWVRCATSLPEGPARVASLAAARGAAARLVEAPPEGASILDRASALALSAELGRSSGDAAGAAVLDQQRLALLEQGERAAKTSAHKESFDHALVRAYVDLGRGDDALALLRRRASERPESYETHGRLGTTLLALGRENDAIPPLERAVELAYGPPRYVYLGRLSRAYAATGQHDLARRALERELQGWASLPPAQKDPARVAEARRRLDEVASPAN
jgi:thioredoxin-like negative regulator of GroEL